MKLTPNAFFKRARHSVSSVTKWIGTVNHMQIGFTNKYLHNSALRSLFREIQYISEDIRQGILITMACKPNWAYFIVDLCTSKEWDKYNRRQMHFTGIEYFPDKLCCKVGVLYIDLGALNILKSKLLEGKFQKNHYLCLFQKKIAMTLKRICN